MKVKIYDNNFAHSCACNGMQGKHIEWIRDNEQHDICFFSDGTLDQADSINCKRKIALLVEPRGIKPSAYTAKYVDKFDYLLTFDREFIKLNPEKILFYPFGCSWINKEDWGIHPKSKLVSMVCSGKRYSLGHIFRNMIYDKFESRIDGYGRYKNPIDNKITALKDYMFSIAIQNTKCDDYFTEYLQDCFITGTVPIFWGTGNIGKYFNADGIIQFNNADDMDKILNDLSPELYQSKMEAIKDNYIRTQEYYSPEDYIFEHYPFLFEVNK